MRDYGYGIVHGLLMGVSIAALIALNANETPHEAPLEEHCAIYSSDLESYDVSSFKCTNGAEFSRKLIKEKGENVK
jgi:hypothetical protein